MQRIDVNDTVRAGRNGERILDDVTVYVTTKAEALVLDTRRFRMGFTLTVIEDGGIYMLDADGDSGGKWRSVADGTQLA